MNRDGKDRINESTNGHYTHEGHLCIAPGGRAHVMN